MSFHLQPSTPGPPQQRLHQGIVVKYSESPYVSLQKSSVLLSNPTICTPSTLSRQLERMGTIIPHKIVDISLCNDAAYVLLPTGQRLKVTVTPPEDQTATSLFVATPIEDFVARPSLSFAGSECLLSQPRAVVIYNALLKTSDPSTNPSIAQTDSVIGKDTQGLSLPYVALIFSDHHFLSISRLLLDGSFRITNCAFDESTVVLSLLSGHILFLDRTQSFQKNNIIDSNNYSYYGLLSYASLASKLMRDFQTAFPGNFSFREALRLLSISSYKHVPFMVFRGCDFVLAMPLGCILIFTRHRLQDSTSSHLVLSHATIALPFVRHDLPNKSFKITHYAASRVSFFLPASDTMLIIGYENSVIQYYCWDIDGMAHPLDGLDLSAGKITHVHAGMMLLPECNDSNSALRVSSPTLRTNMAPIKVLIVATIGSTLFFIVRCFPKMALIATVPAPERFVDCGKICSPTSQHFSSILMYTAVDGSLKYTHLPNGYLFRSGLRESSEAAQLHEQQVRTIQKISTFLKNVSYQYESDESASEVNVLNDRSKAAIPAFLLSSSENECSSCSAEERRPHKRSILDIDNIATKHSSSSRHVKRSRKPTAMSTHSHLWSPLTYKDAFAPSDDAEPKLARPTVPLSISPFDDNSASPHAFSIKQQACRPFEQVTVRLDDEPLLVQIQEMYSLLGMTYRRKLETGERVSYDDNSLTKLKIVRDTRDLMQKTAFMTKNITISEFQRSVSPSLNIQRLLISSRNLQCATELLKRNDHIFRSSRNKIPPHIRNAYLHLKHVDQVTRKPVKKSRGSFRLTKPIANQLAPSADITPLASHILSNPRKSLTWNLCKNVSSVYDQHNTEHVMVYEKSRAFRYLPVLARDLMLDNSSPLLVEPEHIHQNAWSPSTNPPGKANHLANVIMRSRDRHAEILAHGRGDDFIGVLRSKVLEKPAEKSHNGIWYKERENERPKVFVNKYEHIKVIDKELLKDLRRFKALRLGRDLGGRIIRDKEVLSALLTGKNATENLRDIINLADPTNHDAISLDDILSMGKNIISILDPENDYTLGSKQGSTLTSKHESLRFTNTIDYEDPAQKDAVEISRLITPKDTSLGDLRHSKSRSAARQERFGFELLNQMLCNFDYRLNRRRVRSGINGMIAISDDYTKTILLRRSASLPTMETINRTRVELATKLDSALGHEMGISRWDEDANRSYRARIFTIDRLSDPESSIWSSEKASSPLYSSDSADSEDDKTPAPVLNVRHTPTLHKCSSVGMAKRLGLLLDNVNLPRRAYSANQAAASVLPNLEPLDIGLYISRMAASNNKGLHIASDNDKVVVPAQDVLPTDINELEPESLSEEDVTRLSSVLAPADSSTSSDADASDNLVEPSSIFGIKGTFDPSQYALSSTYLPDLLLRTALQDLRKQPAIVTTAKKPLSLLRDDCSQVFKVLRKPLNIIDAKDHGKQLQYGSNPLSRYCMQNHMFCPREQIEFCAMASRDIALDSKRRAYSFDRLEPLILAKAKYGQRPTQLRHGPKLPLATSLDEKDCLSNYSDWSYRDDYDYLRVKPIKGIGKEMRRCTGCTDPAIVAIQQQTSPATHQAISDTSSTPAKIDDYITDIRVKAFTTYAETLALDRLKRKQATNPSAVAELREFKKLFTRELYEDWARLYRHNVIRKDTLYDDQFEVTVMKPTFPLYYHVITNRTEMDGMISNIANEEANDSESAVRANLVVTKAQFPFSASPNQSVDSLFDDLQLALGSWPEQQSEESIIPHHYVLPPKPPYYNPRIPIVDALDGFYDPASIVPLEPLLPEGEDGIRLQVGVFTPYAFCLKNPEFVDNEKLTTILNPVAYTNCKDIILSSSHCEQPHDTLSKYLREAGYLLPDDADSDPPELKQAALQLSYNASFDTKVNEFIASFFSLPKASSADIARYHKGLYSHSVYSLPSHTEGFHPNVRCSMLTIGQAIKIVFTRYFQSFTPIQRKIMSQTAARGVTIDHNRLHYVPYSFLQLLLLYSSALGTLELLKGQRYTSKQPTQTVPLPLSRRLCYILDTQFPIEPISTFKVKAKKDTYGRIASDIYTEPFFNFCSVQDVLTYKCEIFVRYLLIIIYYVRLCNLETCISSFVDYQLRRVLKQDAYIQELSDPYKGVVRIYERMETHICTLRNLQRVKEFSCLYEQCLQESILKATLGEVSKDRAFPFLTYFGPRSDPITLSHMLAKGLDSSAELPPLHSTTLAVVYNDSGLRAEALSVILSKYALSCMLDDTKMHIHGVYAAILNRFSFSTGRSSAENSQYFPKFITNLSAIPLSILLLIRRLEEFESLGISRMQKAIIRRKLHIVLLEAYLRAFTTCQILSPAIFSPLVPMYVHMFRVPRSSDYRDYASMLHRRQQAIYKILYDASIHELGLRVHNNYVIQQPDIAEVIGIPKADVLFNFFSAHFCPAYIAMYTKYTACHKMIIGEGIYSEADDGNKNELSHMDALVDSTPSKIYSELPDNPSDAPISLSWYTSLYNTVTRKPLAECVQRAYKNRYSYDLYEDNVALLERTDQSSYKGDSQFQALVITNRFAEVCQNIEERKLSLDKGCLNEEPTTLGGDQLKKDLPALGRSIFRNRILNTLKSSIVSSAQKTDEDRSILEKSSAEELGISESFGDSVRAGERVLASAAVQLLKTRKLVTNVSKWTEIAEDEESNLEQSCAANSVDTAVQNPARVSFDSTYELRKAFTDIRVPRYRTSSVLAHTNTKRVEILLNKPLPSIPTGATRQSFSTEEGKSPARSLRSVSNS